VKTSIWVFCVLLLMFIVAPVLMVLTFLGPIGAGFGTVFKYCVPVVLCGASVAVLIFYRQGVQGNQA